MGGGFRSMVWVCAVWGCLGGARALADASDSDANVSPENALPDAALMRLGKYGPDAGFYGVYGITFSEDAGLLAARSSDQVVRVWDLKTRDQLCEIDGHEGRVLGLAFAPDGQTLVTSSPGTDEFVKFWNPTSGEPGRKIPGGASIVRFLDEGRQLRVVDTREYRTYRVEDGNRIDGGRSSYQSSETAIAMAEDGSRLAMYNHLHGNQGRHWVALRELATGAQTALTGLSATPTSGRFSPNGKQFFVCCRRRNEVYMWELDEPQQPKSLNAHSEPVQAVAVSADGRLLATASWDKSVRLWEVISGRPIVTLTGHSEHVCAVAFSADALRLASGASGRTDNSVVVWDVRTALFGKIAQQKLDETGLAAQWERLALADPAEAFPALGAMVASPEEATTFFTRQVDAVASGAGQQRIKDLIRDLNAESFAVREAAHRELLKLRSVADVLLRKELNETESAEVRYRITRILETPFQKSTITDNELRRMHRMIFALEIIGTDEALRQLSRLAAGHPHVDIMHSADGAVRRLGGPGKA
jgi:hypothetical protein